MHPEGWFTNAEGVFYPLAPWPLEGSMHLSIWLAPRDALADLLPTGTHPIAWGSRIVVATAWMSYGPGGVLAYHELLCGVLVRTAGRFAVTIPKIWVDSPVSLAGGRELWGIPKELAEFQIEEGPEFTASAKTAGGEIAAFRFRQSLRIPGSRRSGLPVVQTLRGELKITKMLATARCRLGHGEWNIAPGGPLGFLAGSKPLLTIGLSKLAISFGI